MTIAMQHEGVESIGYAVDEDQFLAVHRPRGWERLGAAETFASQQLDHLVRKIEDLKVDELVGLTAIRRGEEVARSAKKADHVAAYKATFAEGFEPVAEDATETPEEPVDNPPAPQELAAAPATK